MVFSKDLDPEDELAALWASLEEEEDEGSVPCILCVSHCTL